MFLNSQELKFRVCIMNIQLDQHVLLWRSLTPRGRPSNSGAEFPSNTLCFCVTFVYDQLAARTRRTMPGATVYSCNSSVATLGGVQRRREQESGRRTVSRVWTNSRKWEKLRRGDSVGLIIILLRNKHILLMLIF